MAKTHRSKHNPRSAKKAQRIEAQAKAKKLNVPQSIADDEDGGKGTRRNLLVISQVNRQGFMVPAEIKPQLVDYQVRVAMDKLNPLLANMAVNTLIRGELRELRERELLLKERELALKQGLVDDLKRQAVPVKNLMDAFAEFAAYAKEHSCDEPVEVPGGGLSSVRINQHLEAGAAEGGAEQERRVS